MKRIQDEGVTNLMLSWTLGGYPSRNIMHTAKYFYENIDNPEVLAETKKQQMATQTFSDAFREFPFHIGVLYQGPQNGGPSNLLFFGADRV